MHKRQYAYSPDLWGRRSQNLVAASEATEDRIWAILTQMLVQKDKNNISQKQATKIECWLFNIIPFWGFRGINQRLFIDWAVGGWDGMAWMLPPRSPWWSCHGCSTIFVFASVKMSSHCKRKITKTQTELTFVLIRRCWAVGDLIYGGRSVFVLFLSSAEDKFGLSMRKNGKKAKR